jgi:hypothetical protein
MVDVKGLKSLFALLGRILVILVNLSGMIGYAGAV